MRCAQPVKPANDVNRDNFIKVVEAGTLVKLTG